MKEKFGQFSFGPQVNCYQQVLFQNDTSKDQISNLKAFSLVM